MNTKTTQPLYDKTLAVKVKRGDGRVCRQNQQEGEGMREEVVICDQCGKRCLPEIEVELNVAQFGDKPDLDFCSWACLLEYAKNKTGQE